MFYRFKLVMVFTILLVGVSAGFRPDSSIPEVTTQSVTSTTPTNNAKPTSVRSLVINYASAVDRVSAEQSLNLYTGNYDLTQNPASFIKLTLASICDGYWRVTNSNTLPISFTWSIDSSTEKSIGVAQPGVTYFYSSRGTKTLRVLVGTTLQQAKAQVAKVCTTQGARTFTWDAGSLKLTQTFSARPLGKYTIAVSTGLMTLAGVHPAEAYVSKFSVIRNPNLPKISLSSPIAFGGGGFNFEAYGAGVEGSTYSWSFGDGTSAGGEAVFKQYTNPGLYTVTLTVTDPTGTVTTAKTTVAQHKNIHDAPSTRANSTNKTFTFDAGASLPGFVYQWNFGDGKSAIGSSVSKTYTNLGFYDVELKVVDNRTEEAKLIAQGYTQAEITELKEAGVLSELEAQAVTEVIAARELTRVNSWKTKPNAKFTATSPQLIAGDVTAGNAPVTISFDAGTSTTASTETYTWDFGDGTPTATGLTTSHTYTTAGRFLVTLTVKDADNQIDTANTFVFVLAAGVKMSSPVRYSQTTPGLQANQDDLEIKEESSFEPLSPEEAKAKTEEAQLEAQQTAIFTS
jgi:PKD repeat protein